MNCTLCSFLIREKEYPYCGVCDKTINKPIDAGCEWNFNLKNYKVKEKWKNLPGLKWLKDK